MNKCIVTLIALCAFSQQAVFASKPAKSRGQLQQEAAVALAQSAASGAPAAAAASTANPAPSLASIPAATPTPTNSPLRPSVAQQETPELKRDGRNKRDRDAARKACNRVLFKD